MTPARVAVALLIVGLASTACTSRPATDDAGGGPLQATEVGITPTEIRVAIVADVDVPGRPGLFQDSVDGLRAWASHVNERGGLAGRTVTVEFHDSRLSPDEFRNATLKACQNALAMVGTTAVADGNVAELARCGIPEIRQLAVARAHREVATSFGIVDSRPGAVMLGPARWYLREFGQRDCCIGLWLAPGDVPDVLAFYRDLYEGQLSLGYRQGRFVTTSARDANFTPYIQAIRSTGANYVWTGSDYNIVVRLRQEARVQGVDSVLVWDCALQCYDPDFLRTGGADVEGHYVQVFMHPFEEADRYPAVKAYLDALRRVNPVAEPNAFSAGTWMAGQLFADAVERTVAEHGRNGLTRARLLDALRGIHDFDADGMTGPIDIGRQLPPQCFAVVQVRGGAFTRVHPDAGLDCDPANVVAVTP